jgi:hypothetical protein
MRSQGASAVSVQALPGALFVRLTTLVERLLAASSIEFEVSESPEHRLTVAAADDSGFDVSLMDFGNEVLVLWGDCHAHFDDEQEAFRCFATGLTPTGRLIETTRGTIVVRSDMERLIDGEWRCVERFGLLFMPFWRRKRVRVYQNRWSLDPVALDTALRTG